jgi:regulator of nonsense transcripts 1
MQIQFRNTPYQPSVFQIRWQGCKGVVFVDKTLPRSSFNIRKSMKKFEANGMTKLGVCEYSRPYRFGHLNKQYLMLLSGLGVPDDVFKQRFQSYYEELQTILTDHEVAFKYAMTNNNIELANKVILLLSITYTLDHFSKRLVEGRCTKRFKVP